MSTIRVLLADDHTVLRDSLRLLLEAQDDIRVVAVASDGRQAVAEAVRHRPDVVIMDIAMPELNGIAATREIRQNNPQTQVLILSMHSTAEHIGRALGAGALGYLLKESAGAEVVAAVRAVHAGKRHLSQKITETVLQDYASHSAKDALDELSPRERDVLQLIAEGKSSAQAAELLSLSPKTVETYRSRIMQKLGLDDMPSLVKFAIRHGLISLE